MSDDSVLAVDGELPPTWDDNQRRMWELELLKVRREAEAARLEARAAEIELMLRGCGGVVPRKTRRGPTAKALMSPTVSGGGDLDRSRHAATHASSTARVVPTREPKGGSPHEADSVQVGTSPSTSIRPTPSRHSTARAKKRRTERAADRTIAPRDPRPPSLSVQENHDITPDRELGDDTKQRWRPSVWLLSGLVHLGVVLILAAIGLQSREPKDQIAFTASSTSSEQIAMETFRIDVNQPPPEINSSPSEVAYELSEFGEISSVKFQPEMPTSISSDLSDSLKSETHEVSDLAIKQEAQQTIEFCGVQGGGNHFVYLVDSSASMGKAFDSARAELLRSIDLLEEDQRFHVVFFDAQSDYMQLTPNDVERPRSVFATKSNKKAVKEWAMTIAMDRGRAPYEPLKFALQLKPDVVFLLSDGEFPQGIEDLLKQENQISNLFGERRPICRVHTIAYHSKVGENRMRRIAAQNQGQYRYVPKQ